MITPEEIREIRYRHGLTQADLAEITEFGESSISRWERGRLFPNGSSSKFLKLLHHNPELVASLKTAANLVEEKLADFDLTPRRTKFPSLPPELVATLAAKANRFALVANC